MGCEMKIELKNIKHADFASEETECFEATIWIDGRRTGTVANDGHGGENRYHPYALQEQLDGYGATLPPHICEWDGSSLPIDADILIGELLNIALAKKALTRLMSKRVVFSRDGKIYQTGILPNLREFLASPDLTNKLQADVVLNLQPIESAIELYRA
jgi:hypothetical protein